MKPIPLVLLLAACAAPTAPKPAADDGSCTVAYVLQATQNGVTVRAGIAYYTMACADTAAWRQRYGTGQ